MSAGGMKETAWLYECELGHVRTSPLRHAFTYRIYLWLVDLDRLPTLPTLLRPLARFDSRDHVGDPSSPLRTNVDSFLAERGIDLRGGRVLMLAAARVFGRVFNPLSVYWCSYPDGTPAAVIAEVHNTYGGRHRYLLDPDSRGRAQTDKQFYVSPFFAVDGEYRMHLPEPDDRLDVRISLRRGDERPFVASLRGHRTPVRWRTIVRCARSTIMTPIRIRRHGAHLYLRGLPVQPRPIREETLR